MSGRRLDAIQRLGYDWMPLPATITSRFSTTTTLRDAFALLGKRVPLAYPWAMWFSRQGAEADHAQVAWLRDIVAYSDNAPYLANLAQSLGFQSTTDNDYRNYLFALSPSDLTDAGAYLPAGASLMAVPTVPPLLLSNYASTTSKGGADAVHTIDSPATPGLEGSAEVRSDMRKAFTHYGRAKEYGAEETSIKPTKNFDNVRWESFYYAPHFGCHLAYKSISPRSVLGEMTVTIRIYLEERLANGVLKKTMPELFKPVPAGFEDATIRKISEAINGWRYANYRISLKDGNKTTKYIVRFKIERTEKRFTNEHFTAVVLNMDHPATDKKWKKASKVGHPNHWIYRILANEWRSNARKLNLADRGMRDMLSHEFGHWIGWGDEYIEVSGKREIGGDSVVFERRAGQIMPLRIALKIKNPTQRYFAEQKTDIELFDLTLPEVMEAKLAGSGESYFERYLYLIAIEFERAYNAKHHGGAATARCFDVTMDSELF